jgi:hypothetical protein
MSNFENKPGRGAAFKNDRKSADAEPDYSGPFKNLDGTDCWISLWISTAKSSGQKYLSISIRPKDADTAQPKKSAGGGTRPQDFDDSSIPF